MSDCQEFEGYRQKRGRLVGCDHKYVSAIRRGRRPRV
jgi:hypothetical protein